MSSKSKFIVGIILMLLAVVVIEYRMPRRFQWNPTFSHKDAQPFGCMVFDSVMAQTMPRGYTVTEKTLWQMQRDSLLVEPHGIVILTMDNLDDHLFDSAIMPLVEQGHVVLLGASELYKWEDTLGLRFDWNGYFNIKHIAGKRVEKQPVGWKDTAGGYSANASLCRVYDQMVSRLIRIMPSDGREYDSDGWVFDEDHGVWVPPDDEERTEVTDSSWNVLVVYDSQAIAVSMSRGKGELIIFTAPLLMTNYAMVNHDNGAVLIHRLMNRMKHLPVIRTEAYMEVVGNTPSPFYVLLERPPFRWALYLTFMGVALYCIFTARRRQRPIPVVSQPQNGNLEFVRLIGTLYWQEGDHQGLLKKKLTYAAEEILRQTGLDIMDVDNERETILQLARLTGMDADNLQVVIRNVKEAADASYRTVNVAEMKALMAELDKIVSNI